jgi:hypothetical protein
MYNKKHRIAIEKWSGGVFIVGGMAFSVLFEPCGIGE